MSKITFIGDVMLSRLIGRKYAQQPYDVVEQSVVDEASDSDLVVANLESPAPSSIKPDKDNQHFIGNPDVLDRLNWIDVFSLSNNHINDSGTEGISETIENLKKRGFSYNGIFEKKYEPYYFEKEGQRIAIVTLTDMLNIPFQDDCKWKTLRMEDEAKVFRVLNECRENGYITILYAHVGMIFTRFPNPATYQFLHSCIDNGADVIVTAHSHCLGGMEVYKGKYIFHSIGDFVMDGSSARRRRACLLKLSIESREEISYIVIPTDINKDLVTVIMEKPEKSLKSFKSVSNKIAKHEKNYKSFYGRQYKIEIIQHSLSTISFLLKERGIIGMFKLLSLRMEEVLRTMKWASSNRSDVKNDQDTLTPGRKIHSTDELY